MNLSKLLNLTLAALLAGSISFSAFAAGVEFSNKAEVDIVTKNKDGTKATKRVPAKKVAPDGEVIYTTTIKNTINKPISNIVVTNPIPANMVYTADSASGANTTISFTVDGKNYDAPEKLTVIGKDGKPRPAQAADFTGIRWLYKGELTTGSSSDVIFKAKVK